MDNDNSFEIFTLFNPSSEDFQIIYNNKLFRTIPPGKAIRLPKKPFGVLAEKHLIDRMIHLEGKQVNDQLARDKWREKIVIEEDLDNSDKVLNPDDVLQRKLDRLNNTNDSQSIVTCDTCNTKTFNLPEHNMLNHATIAPDQPPATIEVVDGTAPVAMPVETPAPSTDGQRHVAGILRSATAETKADAFVLPEQTVSEVEEPAVIPQVTALPTREELITYARDVQKMNIDDPKTREILDTKDISELVTELGYGI